MIEQIIDPPNLGFRTLVVIYLKSILAIFQKNHLHASETGKIWKQTIFSIWWSKLSTPQPKFFSTLAVIYFQIIIANFHKKIVGCNWNWKVLKAD